MIDATGQIVTPGLVDLHAHVFHKMTLLGHRPRPVAIANRRDDWNDAGSVGAMTIAGFRECVVEPAKVGITSRS